MPSKTFFHLPAEKRERLLLAAEGGVCPCAPMLRRLSIG